MPHNISYESVCHVRIIKLSLKRSSFILLGISSLHVMSPLQVFWHWRQTAKQPDWPSPVDHLDNTGWYAGSEGLWNPVGHHNYQIINANHSLMVRHSKCRVKLHLRPWPDSCVPLRTVHWTTVTLFTTDGLIEPYACRWWHFSEPWTAEVKVRCSSRYSRVSFLFVTYVLVCKQGQCLAVGFETEQRAPCLVRLAMSSLVYPYRLSCITIYWLLARPNFELMSSIIHIQAF